MTPGGPSAARKAYQMREENIPGKPEGISQNSADMFIVEFEAALMALNHITPMNNPCLKKTMNLGPKKLIGK